LTLSMKSLEGMEPEDMYEVTDMDVRDAG